MPKFEPIRVIISKNSPLENPNKIEGEIRNPISEIIKEMKTIDELKSKVMEPIVNVFLNEDVLSQTKANAGLIALNAQTNEIEKYRYAVRDATELKKEAMGELRTFRNELIASNPLKAEAERLSIAPSAGELGKLKAVLGEESGIQGTINMADSNVSSADHKKIMEKLRRATEKNWPSINQSVASKGNVMGINIESKDYKYFLERIEACGDNVGIELYKLFYNDDEIRRIVLASAIHDGEINFHVETGKGEVFPVNTAIVHIELDPLYAEHEAHDEKRKEIIESYLTAYNEDRYKHLKMNLMLFLETKSFLAWLKKKYPYEGEGQAKEEQEKKDAAQSQIDSPQSKKRESNLLKVIGGLIRTNYLQKDSGKYWNGDKPNISAIAGAFQADLSKAGYSDEGFQDSSLRKTISDALERIEENKNT